MTLRARAHHRLAATAFLAAIALALLLAAPSQSSAVTFGANLDRAPDNAVACNDPGWFFFYTFPTCSAESNNPSTGESGFPPVGNGVVTKIRVRVGPVTGPMQIVVEQALRADNPGDPGHPTYACCKAINAGPVFTPAPNAITAQNVRLPVRQDIAPDPSTGLYVDQHLALSVLAPNVPIPASTDPNAAFGVWFPAWQVGEERANPYGSGGATILFNADWQSCGKAGAAAVAQTAKKGKKKRKAPCGKKKKKKKKK